MGFSDTEQEMHQIKETHQFQDNCPLILRNGKYNLVAKVTSRLESPLHPSTAGSSSACPFSITDLFACAILEVGKRGLENDCFQIRRVIKKIRVQATQV